LVSYRVVENATVVPLPWPPDGAIYLIWFLRKTALQQAVPL